MGDNHGRLKLREPDSTFNFLFATGGAVPIIFLIHSRETVQHGLKIVRGVLGMISKMSEQSLAVYGVGLPTLMSQACFVNPNAAVDGFFGGRRQAVYCFHEREHPILLGKGLSRVKCRQSLVHRLLN